jgi:nucleosome assembly protein 1-like 1
MANIEGKKNLNDLLRAGGYDDDIGSPFSQNLAEAPKVVQKRISALKKYQLENIQLESKFYQRVHELEKEYQPLFDAINAKRAAIVSGEYEPSESECTLPVIHGLSPENLEKLATDAADDQVSGVPKFWYHCLNNTAQISDMIKEYDAPILEHLTDITVEIHDNPTGFSLHFLFSPNEYFTNNKLTKYYTLDILPDDSNPFEYDGPTVNSCTGTVIDWKDGKNVTQKIVKKKQKKGSAAGRFITKTVQNDSFFNYFDPSEKTISEDMDPETAESLRNDFEVGQIIRDQLIPRAVLFYTGEAAEDEDAFDDFGDEGESDEESDHDHE